MTVMSKIRRQGGAAIMTIPPALLKLMHADVGSQIELDVNNGELSARAAVRATRKRYGLQELLKGSEQLVDLNASTAWAREGDPVGRESA